MICGHKPLYILKCLACHFGLSCFVGWLAYLLTSTTLSHTILFHDGVGVFSTSQFSLLVALCCACLAHIVEDYTWDRF